MNVHLVNPSHVSFGTSVITPRWLYVIAGATPASFGDPILVDETLSAVDPSRIQRGDVVGIGIHTGNALRGYEIGRLARQRGAYVVFGGIHATLYPEEALSLGRAHAVVKGDGDVVWATVLEDCRRGAPGSITYSGGRVEGETLCLRAGILCRATAICGHRYRPSAVVRSTAPSARFGGRTVSALVSPLQT